MGKLRWGLLVGMLCAIVGLAGCGGGDSTRYTIGATSLGGGQASRQQLEQAAGVLNKRADSYGADADFSVQDGRLEANVSDGTDAAALVSAIGHRGQLRFYDWEPNVIGPDCKPVPDDASVTGGPQAGSPGAGSLTHVGALKRAKKCRARVESGVVVVQAESADGDTREDKAMRVLARDSFFVVRDDAAMTGSDIKDPKQGTDQSGQPNVNFNFTSSGKDRWRRFTRDIVQRGQEQSLPGQDNTQAFQHFAMVLDDQIISVPYIDFTQNPDGIDGANGSEISGGFTVQSAHELAAMLRAGALPVQLGVPRET